MWWVWVLVGVSYLAIIGFIVWISWKENRDNKIFWEKYFGILKRKSEYMNRMVEGGKAELICKDGKMYFVMKNEPMERR